MTVQPLRQGETVILSCETCEPEPVVVVRELPPCPDCSCRFYRVQTVQARMLLDCCGSILHPLN